MKFRRALLVGAVLFAGIGGYRFYSALAESELLPPSVSVPFQVKIVPVPLIVKFSPTTVKVPCDVPAGTVVATVSTEGGNGKPITPVLSGTTDFVLSGWNVVVAHAGIGAWCAGHAEMIHVAALQVQ
jgi:hypothetical protein